MSEPLRNQVEITLAGENRIMKASFSALRAIERDTRKSIIELALGAGTLSVTDAATVIHYGLHGNGDTRLKSVDETGEAVMAAGVEKCMTAAVEFLTQALTGASLGKPEVAAPTPQ